ncbi:hypothetical protein HK405_012274, partial [Cladochytrium tenue]
PPSMPVPMMAPDMMYYKSPYDIDNMLTQDSRIMSVPGAGFSQTYLRPIPVGGGKRSYQMSKATDPATTTGDQFGVPTSQQFSGSGGGSNFSQGPLSQAGGTAPLPGLSQSDRMAMMLSQDFAPYEDYKSQSDGALFGLSQDFAGMGVAASSQGFTKF